LKKITKKGDRKKGPLDLVKVRRIAEKKKGVQKLRGGKRTGTFFENSSKTG